MLLQELWLAVYILEFSRCSLSGIWKTRLSMTWEKSRLCCDGRVFVKGSGEIGPKVHRSFSWKFSGSPELAEVILLIDHLERICSCVTVTPHIVHSPHWDGIIIGNPPLDCWLITVSLICWCEILLDFWSQKRIASVYVFTNTHVQYNEIYFACPSLEDMLPLKQEIGKSLAQEPNPGRKKSSYQIVRLALSYSYRNGCYIICIIF